MCCSDDNHSTHQQQQQQQQQPGNRTRRSTTTTTTTTSSSTGRRHSSDDDDGAAYVPPPSFVVAGSSPSSSFSSRALRGGEKQQQKKKMRRTAAADSSATAAWTASGASSSSIGSETSSSTSASSSAASLDDRIWVRWVEMRAKERSDRAASSAGGNALALDKVVGETGRGQRGVLQGGSGSRRRGVSSGSGSGGNADDSSDMNMTTTTTMMMIMDDDASDATLKVANSSINSPCATALALGVATVEGPPPPFFRHNNLYSTPIFTATLVEQHDDHDDDAHDRNDPLEIMEWAKAAARQEILREAVEATVVVPIGDDDNNGEEEGSAAKAATSSEGDTNNSSTMRCRRIGITVAVLVLVWAAVAGMIVSFVAARSAATTTTTTPPPPGSDGTGSTTAGNSGSTATIGNQLGASSSMSSSMSIVGTITYGAASDEALGVSADGSVLAVGTLGDAATGMGGVVRVWQRQNGHSNNNNAWTEQGVISDDGVDYFGFAIGMSGSGARLVVGAPGGVEIGDPDTQVPGSVRVYDYDAAMNMWESPYGRITGLAEGGMFGHSVAISGDASTIVAGAPAADNVGMAQAWTLSEESGQWEQLGQDLYGDVPDSHFGESTALSKDGQVLVVGGCGANPMEGTGSVHAYRFDDSANAWEPLGPAMFGNSSMERWGWDVTVSGDGQVMAASANVFSAQRPGSVHVSRYNDAVGAWEPYGDALVGELHQRFGYTVSLSHDGTFVAVGIPGIKGVASGSVQVYKFDGYAHTWNPTIAPEATHGGSPTDGLGEAVALSSDGKLVAASSATSGYTEVIALN